MDPQRRRARAWAIHWVALGLWALIYIVFFWDTWTLSGVDRLGAVFTGMLLLPFALVSTLIVWIGGPRPVVPAVMHGLVVSALAMFLFGPTSSEPAAGGERDDPGQGHSP